MYLTNRYGITTSCLRVQRIHMTTILQNIIKKTGIVLRDDTGFYYVSYKDYSATSVKRRKAVILSSLSCFFNHSATLALSPSPNWNS